MQLKYIKEICYFIDYNQFILSTWFFSQYSQVNKEIIYFREFNSTLKNIVFFACYSFKRINFFWY